MISRLLTPRDFGVVAIALIFVGVIGITGKLGIGPAIVQRSGLSERHVGTGFVLSAVLGAVLTAAVWFASPEVARFFADPEAPAILGALSAVFVITGLGEVSEHLLRRRLRFGLLMLATLLSQAAGYGFVAIALALHGFGAWSLVGGLLARHALFTAVVVACRPPPLRPTLARREAAELLRFGAGLVAEIWRREWEEHHARVRATIPPEQLLVFDIESDSPLLLCEFAGLPPACARHYGPQNHSLGPLGWLVARCTPLAVKRLLPPGVRLPLKRLLRARR